MLTPPTRWLGSIFEKEGDWYCENIGQLLQAASTDAISRLLVFLHLLESDAQLIGELFLAHVKHEATHADAATNVFVSWKGVFG
jgi:hypothetical protein